MPLTCFKDLLFVPLTLMGIELWALLGQTDSQCKFDQVLHHLIFLYIFHHNISGDALHVRKNYSNYDSFKDMALMIMFFLSAKK